MPGSKPETNPPGNIRVFLSYSRRDAIELARHLRNDLCKAGFRPWLDKEEIQGGNSWSREIEAAIDESDFVVALMTAASFISDICRAEQMRALRKNKRVIPALAQSGADRPLYFEHLHYLDFSDPLAYATAYRELLKTVADPNPPDPLPPRLVHTRINAPPPPLAVVERPEELSSVRKILLGSGEEKAISVTGLRGMGGGGKTVLAQLLCLDPVVQAAFPDGIVWIGMGRDPGDLVAPMRTAGAALGDEPAWYATLESSSGRLRTLLQDRAVLLVLDDVWDARHVEPFRTAARRCRILFTSRNATVASSLGAREHILGPANAQASAILARWAGLEERDLPPEAATVVSECGALPLALAMIGAMLRGKPDRWSAVVKKLRTSRLESIERQLPSYPYPNLARAIQISVDELELPARSRYLELAAFPEDQPIPEDALTLLWNCDLAETQDTVDTFLDRSLALPEKPGWFRLHDLQHNYLRDHFSAAELIPLRDRIVKGYRERAGEVWPREPKDSYFYSFFPFHLTASGMQRELRGLLLDFAWLEAKLQATDIAALISDYRDFPSDQNLNRLQRALRLSAHVLAQDKSQLASQLYGRLVGCGWPDGESFIAKLERIATNPWLKTMTPSLVQAGGPLLLTFTGHDRGISALAVSPDGKHAVSGAADGQCKIWEIETGAVIRTITGHEDEITSIAISPDGSLVISAARDKTIRIWDFATGRLVRQLQGHVVAIADDCRKLVTSTERDLFVWDLASEAGPLCALQVDTHVTAAAVSPGGKYLLVATWETGVYRDDAKTLSVYSLPACELSRKFEAGSAATVLRFTSDGEKVISASNGYGGAVRVWSMATNLRVGELLGEHRDIYGMSITPDDRHVLTAGSGDYSIQMWAIAEGREVRRFIGHTGFVKSIAITKDGRRLLSASSDKTVRVWDLEATVEASEYTGHSSGISDIAFARGARVSYTASHDGPVRRWSVEEKREISSRILVNDWTLSVAVTTDGKRLLTGTFDGTALFWDVETGQALWMIPHPSRWLKSVSDEATFVNAVALSPDGRFAITAFNASSIRLSDLLAPRERRFRPKSIRTAEIPANAIAFFPDGQRAAIGCADRECRIWDLASGEVVMTLPGHEDSVEAVAVTLRGDHLISGSLDRTVRVWSWPDGKARHVLEHPAPVHAVAVSDDGRWVLAGFGGGFNQMFSAGTGLGGCALWDLESGHPKAMFYGESSVEACALIGCDGLMMAGEESGRLHFLQLTNL